MKNFLFSGLTEKEIAVILKNTKPIKYLKGDFLLSVGDEVSKIGLIVSGSVHIIQEDFWGNRNLIAEISKDNIFGEAFACTRKKSINVSVQANSDTEIIWFDFEKLLSYDKIAKNLITGFAEKSIMLNEKLTHIGKRTTKEKLLSYLSAQAIRHKNSEFDIPFNRQTLADYLSVERSAMSAELSKLKKSGVIDFNKNHFKLLNKID